MTPELRVAFSYAALHHSDESKGECTMNIWLKQSSSSLRYIFCVACFQVEQEVVPLTPDPITRTMEIYQ